MRLLHLLVIGALVFAAAYVYRIKMDSTVRTERVLKLHAEIREERDKIAVLRAECRADDGRLFEAEFPRAGLPSCVVPGARARLKPMRVFVFPPDQRG